MSKPDFLKELCGRLNGFLKRYKCFGVYDNGDIVRLRFVLNGEWLLIENKVFNQSVDAPKMKYPIALSGNDIFVNHAFFPDGETAANDVIYIVLKHNKQIHDSEN